MTTTPTTYTPGPWTITVGEKGSGISNEAKHCSLAYVFGLNEGSRANARLIAAAPALLAALKECQRYLVNQTGNWERGLAEQVGHAIAQAEDRP